MPSANALGEEQIPSPAPRPPMAGEAAEAEPLPGTAAQIAAIIAALTKLMVYAAYLNIMLLLGWRIRKPRNEPANPKPRATRSAAPSPAPKPRQVHRYLDRAEGLAVIADLNAALRQAFPAPPAPQTLAQATPGAPSPQPSTKRPLRRPDAPFGRLRSPPAATSPITRAALRPHPPPGSKNPTFPPHQPTPISLR